MLNASYQIWSIKQSLSGEGLLHMCCFKFHLVCSSQHCNCTGTYTLRSIKVNLGFQIIQVLVLASAIWASECAGDLELVFKFWDDGLAGWALQVCFQSRSFFKVNTKALFCTFCSCKEEVRTLLWTGTLPWVTMSMLPRC